MTTLHELFDRVIELGAKVERLWKRVERLETLEFCGGGQGTLIGGAVAGWTIGPGAITADGGSAELSSAVPSLRLGATGYLNGAGFWVGKSGGVYKAHLGDPTTPGAHYLKWDGNALVVVGNVTATTGQIGGWTIGATAISADSGAAVIDASTPKITLGLASDYLTGAGFFVGKSSGAYKLHIGDPAGNYLKWDGSALTVKGSVTTDSLNPALQSFTTNIVFSSTDNDTVSWSAGTIRLASGVTYAIDAGNTGNMVALTYIYLDTAVSTTALQTTTTYSNAVGDGRLLLAAAQNHAAGASVIPYTGQQPLINATDQITALSITAAQIAANTITAGKISVSTLAAIQANIGAATISDVLTIGASGGIYQGSGTFASPTTGLKMWNDGGVGRLATYLSGTPQVYFDTSGKLLAGGGNVTLDANGVTLICSDALDLSRSYKVKNAGGSTVAAIYGMYQSTPYVATSFLAYSDGTTVSGDALLGLQARAPTGKESQITFTNYINSVTKLSVSLIGSTQMMTINPGSLTISAGGLNVGVATGAGPGDIKASGNGTITGTLSVGGSNIIAHTTGEGSLGGDVAMAVANTYYAGPSVTLGAGTWFVTGHVTVTDTAANLFTAKLWDGTTVESSGEVRVADVSPGWGVIALEGIVTLTGSTAVKISVAALNASGSVKAACTNNGAGNNASHIQAVRII